MATSTVEKSIGEKLKKSRKINFINSNFQKKSVANRLLRATRDKKLTVLYKLASSLQFLLSPLFSSTKGQQSSDQNTEKALEKVDPIQTDNSIPLLETQYVLKE